MLPNGRPRYRLSKTLPLTATSLVNLTEGSPEALYGLRVSANLLPMLGVAPQLGQWLSAEQNRPGHTHVVLLSDDLWRRSFHADPKLWAR